MMNILCDDGTQVLIEMPSVDNIGVLLSGGMDSALLLYLLLLEKITINSKTEITIFNVPNVKDDAAIHSLRIIRFLENYFSIKLNFKYTGDTTLPHYMIINQPAADIINTNMVDILYSGVTQNPPNFFMQGPYRRRPDMPTPPRYSYPFLKLYKTH